MPLDKAIGEELFVGDIIPTTPYWVWGDEYGWELGHRNPDKPAEKFSPSDFVGGLRFFKCVVRFMPGPPPPPVEREPKPNPFYDVSMEGVSTKCEHKNQEYLGYSEKHPFTEEHRCKDCGEILYAPVY